MAKEFTVRFGRSIRSSSGDLCGPEGVIRLAYPELQTADKRRYEPIDSLEIHSAS